jgi:hypothetical protein
MQYEVELRQIVALSLLIVNFEERKRKRHEENLFMEFITRSHSHFNCFENLKNSSTLSGKCFGVEVVLYDFAACSRSGEGN